MARVRLDELLVARGLAETRSSAITVIRLGHVCVNGQPADKPGMQVPADATIEVRTPSPHVSRAGAKLAAALDAFGVDPQGLACLDVGASTGGFTDVLLQRGAARVYAVDVGKGQLSWKLRQDARVVNMDRTDIRDLEQLPEPIPLATVDVAFISTRLVLPAVAPHLAPAGHVVVLLKPQFEAGRDRVPRGGVVRSPDTHRAVLLAFCDWCAHNDWLVRDAAPSPITGTSGNREFLLLVAPRAWGGAGIDRDTVLRRAMPDAPSG